MSDRASPSPGPGPSSDTISQHSFSVTRRGFDQREVREFLQGVATEIRRLGAAEALLSQRNGELGTRIGELEARLEQMKTDAGAEIDEAAIVAVVGEEMAQILRNAHAAAAELRTRASAKAAEVVSEAQDAVASQRAEAERLLGVASAEAEGVASRIRAEAVAEAEGLLAAARADAEKLVTRAKTEAEETREGADRDRRLTVEGAQAIRERILADLARRRRVATVQIEQLRAGRERLLESYGVVRRTLEEVHDELQRADTEARAAADEAGRKMEADGGGGVTRRPTASTDAATGADAAEPEAAPADTGEPDGAGWPTAGEAEPPAGDGGPGTEVTPQVDIAPEADSRPAPAEPGAARAGEEDHAEEGDGAEGDGAEGDGAEGDGAEGDGAEGDGAEGDGAEGDGAEGDGAEGDGAEGDGAEGDGAEDDDGGGGGGHGGDDGGGADGGSSAGADVEREDRATGGVESSGDVEESGGRMATRQPGDLAADGADDAPGAGGASGAAESGDDPSAGPAGSRSWGSGGPESRPAPASPLPRGPVRIFRPGRAEPTAQGPTGPTGVSRLRVLAGGAATAAVLEPEAPSASAPVEEAGFDDAAGVGLDSYPSEGTARSDGGRRPSSQSDQVSGLFSRIRAGREQAVSEARQVLRDSPATAAVAGVPADHVDPAPSGFGETVVPSERTHAGTVTDEGLLQRRDRVLDAIQQGLARRLKRALRDEQNTLLDCLRNPSTDRSFGGLVADSAAQTSTYVDAGRSFIELAARCGVEFAAEMFGGSGAVVETAPVVEEMVADLVAPLRRRLETVCDQQRGEDQEVIADALGSVYREAKKQRIERLAADYVVAAFTQGTWQTVPAGTLLRWVAEDADGPCADCDDNTLAGGVAKGEPFPTGQLYPPAHDGCRCLLAPAFA